MDEKEKLGRVYSWRSPTYDGIPLRWIDADGTTHQVMGSEVVPDRWLYWTLCDEDVEGAQVYADFGEVTCPRCAQIMRTTRRNPEWPSAEARELRDEGPANLAFENVRLPMTPVGMRPGAKRKPKPEGETGTILSLEELRAQKEKPMADDPTKQDNRDRSRVAGDQDYEVQYFAETNGISLDQARDLIERFGNDREKLEQEVKKLT